MVLGFYSLVRTYSDVESSTVLSNISGLHTAYLTSSRINIYRFSLNLLMYAPLTLVTTFLMEKNYQGFMVVEYFIGY